MRYFNKYDAPIQLNSKALSYVGYAGASGKSVALAGNSNASDERLAHLFPLDEANKGIVSGDVYLSALINVEEAGNNAYSISFLGANYKAPADGESFGVPLGAIFLLEGDDAGTFKLGMAKSYTKAVNSFGSFELNKTHLVVMKYTFVDGSANDVFSVWVNPSDFSVEGTPDLTMNTTTDININNGGMQGIALAQSGTSLKSAPKLLVDQLRVATTWAELFGGEGGGEEPEQPEQPGDAAITVSAPGIDFEYTIQGAPVEKTLTVSGTGLTGDITASVSSSDFKLSTNTIAKADAEAGATITVTYTAAKAGAATGSVTFRTAGAEDVVVSLKGEAQKVTTLAMSTAIINQNADDGELYRYTQKATVTYVDAAKSRVYAQDIVGGLCIDFSYMDGVPLAVGDVFNNVLCYITKEQGVPYLLAIANVAKTGSGTKSPTEVSAASLLQDPESYIHRLVTLTDDVLFEGVNEGDTLMFGKYDF